MAEVITVQHGNAPWKPTADAELVDVYHRYDQPLVGLIRQRGTYCVFRCIAGEIEPASLWAYARVDHADIEKLEQATIDSFDGVLDEIMSRGPGVIVAATDALGIIADVVAEELADDLTGLVDELISAFDRHVEQQRRVLDEMHGLAAAGA